jgi:hydrogenase maturation protein HypF
MIASLASFERFGHLEYYPLAGGDKASKEAVRPLLSLLRQAYAEAFKPGDFTWLLERVEPDERRLRLVLEQLDKGINAVSTSSLGRVFDAVAAMLGLGTYNHFDAQLPMVLESIADARVDDQYEYDVRKPAGEPLQLSLRRLVRGLIDDVRRAEAPAVISARFHNTLAEALLALAKAARESTRLETIALSGGVFCNRYLVDRLVMRLKQEGFAVLLNRDVPSNDGGIALGQAVIAARLAAHEG